MHLVQDLKDLRRFEEIVSVLLKNGFGYVIEKLKRKKVKLEPKRIRLVLQELGGTFVKLGQLLSLRPDLIPKEYCDEFSKLQDNVDPFSSNEAKEIMEKEIGKVSYFNKKPIAAASIGQVHEAIVKKNKEKIVIKIQRPDIKKKIEIDIDIMYKLARLIEKKKISKIIKPTEIVQEFERYTKNELDYIKEANNCNRIYNNFKKDKNVIIPKPYLDLTTKRVLTLEYIKGKKLNIKNKKIASILANAIFKQVFIDGFFHADPHPGNIFVLPNNRIALLDFGIVGKLDNELKNKITDLFVATINKDVGLMTEALLDIGVVENINIDSFKEDLRNDFGKYYNTKLSEIKFVEVFEKIINLAKKYNIKFPINFILLGKCIMTTESVCYSLNPDFNFVKTSKPFVEKLIRKKYNPEEIFNKIAYNLKKFKDFFLRLPKEEKEIMNEIKKVDEEIGEVDKDIKNLTKEIEKTSNRRVLGYIIAALIISAAITFNNKNLSIYLFIISFILFVIFIISYKNK